MVVPEIHAKAAAKASTASRVSRIFSAASRKRALAASVTLSRALKQSKIVNVDIFLKVHTLMHHLLMH